MTYGLHRSPRQRDGRLVGRRVVEEVLDEDVDVIDRLQRHHTDLILQNTNHTELSMLAVPLDGIRELSSG